MRLFGAAAIGMLAIAASGADRPQQRFLAVSATSYNPSAAVPPGAILLYDRETATPISRFDFAGQAEAPAVTPDGRGLYVVVSGGPQPGIGVIDLGARALRAFVPIPGVQLSFAANNDRVFALTSTGIVALDRDATRVLANVPCPGPPTRLIYNPTDGAAYATMSNRPDLCVVTRDLQSAPSLPTPIGIRENIDATVLLERNILLLSVYRGGVGPYQTYALDLASGRSMPVPSLDGMMAALLKDDQLYGYGADGVYAFAVAFGSDGFPILTPRGAVSRPLLSDDRFVYTGVSGYCSTLEGPVLCNVGFRMLDPITLNVVHSVVLADPVNSGLMGARAIGLPLSVPMPPPSTAARRLGERSPNR